jgi:hypothetical protein
LDESVDVMVFRAMDAYSSLGRTRVVYKTERLWGVEKEEVI